MSKVINYKDGWYSVYEEDNYTPVYVSEWDLEFYGNIKSLYPMMGGDSHIGMYMYLANCIRLVLDYKAQHREGK